MRKLLLATAAALVCLGSAAYADTLDPLHGECTSGTCIDNGSFTPTPNLMGVGFSASPAQSGMLELVELVPTNLQSQFSDSAITGTGLPSGGVVPTQASGEFTSGTLESFLGLGTTTPNNPFGGFQVGADAGVNSFSVYTVKETVTLALNLPSQPLADVFMQGGAIPTGTDLVGFLLNSSVGGTTATAPSGQLQVSGTIGSTPLPAALPLFASGLGALGLLGWRRRRKAQPVA